MRRFAYILVLLCSMTAFASPDLTLEELHDSIVSSRVVMMEIPDSLANDVMKLLDGHHKVVRNSSESDIDELVIVGHDTVTMASRGKNLGRYDRGLFNYLFIPKDAWMFGVTASYGEFSSSDLQLLDLLSDLDFTGHIFSINPYISYFIRNNLSMGLRVGYSSGRATLGSFKMDFDEDLNLDIKDVMYHSESLKTSLFVRQFIGLARKGRFGVYNELELSFQSGNSDFRRPYNGVPKNTHTTTHQLGLNFSPGITIFINEYASFNLQFGVVGFYLRDEKQLVDNEEVGSRLTSGANFKFNIFNINFGLGIHL